MTVPVPGYCDSENPPSFTYLKVIVPAPVEITNIGEQMYSISFENFFKIIEKSQSKLLILQIRKLRPRAARHTLFKWLNNSIFKL